MRIEKSIQAAAKEHFSWLGGNWHVFPENPGIGCSVNMYYLIIKYQKINTNWSHCGSFHCLQLSNMPEWSYCSECKVLNMTSYLGPAVTPWIWNSMQLECATFAGARVKLFLEGVWIPEDCTIQQLQIMEFTIFYLLVSGSTHTPLNFYTPGKHRLQMSCILCLNRATHINTKSKWTPPTIMQTFFKPQFH